MWTARTRRSRVSALAVAALFGLTLPARALDLSTFDLVDPSTARTDFAYAGFNRVTAQISYRATITNVSANDIAGTLYLSIDSATSALVSVANEDDTSDGGLPLFRVLDAGALAPGESRTVTVRFQTPARPPRFTFESSLHLKPADLTPPDIAIVSPADGATVPDGDNPPDVEVTFDDADSGVDTGSLQILVDGVPVSPSCVFDGVVGASCALPAPLATGAVAITATVSDLAGNSASDTVVVVVEGGVTDVTPPTITILAPADGATISVDDNPPAIVLELDDAGSGIDPDSVEIRVDGTPVTATCTLTGLVGASCALAAPLPTGLVTLTATVADRAANTASHTIEVAVEAPVTDTTPPTVDIVSPADGATILAGDNPPAIVLDFDDVGSGIDPDSVEIRVDGTPVTATCTLTGLVGASCALAAPLPTGLVTLTATVADRAGNTASHTIEVEVEAPVTDTTPPTLGIVSPADGATVPAADNPPIVRLTFDDVGGGIDPDSFQIRLDGAPVVANCQRSGPTLGFCELAAALPAGTRTLAARVSDLAGNATLASIEVTVEAPVVDVTPPTIDVVSPAENALVATNTPTVKLALGDDVAIDTTSAQLLVDGSPIAATCTLGQSGGDCVVTEALDDGAVSLTVRIRDTSGNTAEVIRSFVVDGVAATIAIQSPAAGLVTGASSLQVSGTVGAGVEQVVVNGVAATLGGGTFNATVPLREGPNMLVAIATRASGRTGTASVSVTRDTGAPTLRINSPPDGFRSNTDTVTVTGSVNDIVTGGANPRVIVNGIEAFVQQGTFMAPGVPLVRGPNTVFARAIDEVGNEGTTQIAVSFSPPTGNRLLPISGDGQAALVNTRLPAPLVARVVDNAGQPLASRVVRFEVSRGDGVLDDGAGGSGRMLEVTTNGAGLAQVFFTIGRRSGEGNNQVRATSVGAAGEAIFCATGQAALPDKILAVMGENQTGLAGAPLPEPFEVLVIDMNGNPLGGVAAVFSVSRGGGNLDGAMQKIVMTGADGVARALLTLGPEEGVVNNLVSVGFDGNPGLPVSFAASALLGGRPEDTRFAGVVLDNTNTPIPGAVVHIAGSDGDQITDDKGQFLLTGVPVGAIHLEVDASTSPRPQIFPKLAFEASTVAGRINRLPNGPIRIPPLVSDAKLVGGSDDVVLQMPGVPGLTLTVFANSTTFPDGSSTGLVSINQVHLDKIPMPPPSGTIFMPPAWTVQPPGVHFDPPAKITIPNDGLAPGRVIDIFQFDHDINRFVNVGPGTTDDEGLLIISDPGFGITKSGWGGCGQPQPPPTCVCGCDDGNVCTMDSCSGQPNCNCTNTPYMITGTDAKAGGQDTLVSAFDATVNFTAAVTHNGCPGGIGYDWAFGDGDTSMAQNPGHQYAMPGDFTATLNAECRPSCDTGSDSVSVKVVKADLQMQGLPEETQPMPHEENPGAVVMRNDDDDDMDGMPDEDQGAVAGENDLVPVTLSLTPAGVNKGTATLRALTGASRIAIWDSAGKATQITLPMIWDLTVDTLPGTLFVEGVDASAAEADVNLQLEFTGEDGSMHSDVVRITVVQVDLDVDSDSNGTILANDDPIEAPMVSDSTPSPYLGVNNDDDDDDLIQDRFRADTNTIAVAADAMDMQLARLRVMPPGLTGAMVALKATSGENRIRLYDVTSGIGSASRVTISGAGTTFAVANLPRDLRIEGVLPSAAKRDVKLEAEMTLNGMMFTDKVNLTVAEIDVIVDRNTNGNIVEDRDNSVDFVTLMRVNDRIESDTDLGTHEMRNAFFVQVEDLTRSAGAVELVIRSFDTGGTEIDSILGLFGGINIPMVSNGHYQSGACWVVFDNDLDNGSTTLRGVPGGTLRIEYNDDTSVPRTIVREFFIVDASVQGSSTVPAFEDTGAVPVVFENNEVDGMPGIAADLAAFNNDQRWRIELTDPRDQAQADVTVEVVTSGGAQRDNVVLGGAPAGQYRLPKVSARTYRSNDIWAVQARAGGAQNPAINDAANAITLNALPSAGDRLRVRQTVVPLGGKGQPGGPVDTMVFRDVAVVGVDFDGVQGLNSGASVSTINLAATRVAGTETVGFGFDERARNHGGGAVQAALSVCDTDLFFDNIDDNNFSQVVIQPATTSVEYVFSAAGFATVSPTTQTGSGQIDIDGDNAGNVRLHARLDDTDGMILATLGVRVVAARDDIDVGVFVVDTQTPAAAAFNAHTRPADVPGLITAAENIWAQDCIGYEVVHGPQILSGGDVDAAPLGNFPAAEDTDLDGDGVLEPTQISAMHTIDLAERQALQAIGQNQLTLAGDNPNSILLIFARQNTTGLGTIGITTLGGQRTMIFDGGPATRREGTVAHELGHALNISGDHCDTSIGEPACPGPAGGADPDADTDTDESRETELMHFNAGPQPRDLELGDAMTGRTGANAFPQ